jgi:glycosyltransferase involved in cell wall biosynthesis
MGEKKIKILMHTQPNLTSFNAQDLNGRYIASKLDENKFEIFFINTLDENIDPKLLKPNIHIFNVYNYNKILRKLLIFKYKLLHKYDISFYIRVFKADSLFLRLLKFFDKKRKTIHMVESMVPYLGDEEYNKWAKFNALNSDYTFSISKKVRETVKKEYKIDTDIMHVGVDLDIFKPYPKEKKERLRVVGCGTLTPMKQPLLFLKIAKKFPNVDFVWIGEGELKDNILRRSKSVSNFKLLGNMSHQELAKYFSNSDIFLFPSLHEGFPKVVIESMACGLPSIVFDRYGPEAVIDNETGFIVSNEKEMIEKLEILIKNKTLRDKFSQNAIKRAKEFDWNKIVKQWEDFLIKVAK